MSEYDSTDDTLDHVEKVRENILGTISNLVERGKRHDDSKFEEPEKSIFDATTPRLKDSTYGSDEYKGFLKEMKPALDHHYENNSHHPEHYENGIDGMSLLDLLEMLADWKAATERHADGNLEKSLEINKERFKISPQLQSILENTVKEMGW